MSYEIDEGVPLTTPHHYASKYPWPEMRVGDSVRFEDPEEARRAYMAARNWTKRRGLRACIRKEENRYGETVAHRIWILRGER